MSILEKTINKIINEHIIEKICSMMRVPQNNLNDFIQDIYLIILQLEPDRFETFTEIQCLQYIKKIIYLNYFGVGIYKKNYIPPKIINAIDNNVPDPANIKDDSYMFTNFDNKPNKYIDNIWNNTLLRIYDEFTPDELSVINTLIENKMNISKTCKQLGMKKNRLNNIKKRLVQCK